MTIVAEPVTYLTVADARQLMDRHEVGALIGVSGDTVLRYLNASKAGGRYEEHPFPTPRAEFDGRPAWTAEQSDDIVAWAAARPGQGAGGGRPAHREHV